MYIRSLNLYKPSILILNTLPKQNIRKNVDNSDSVYFGNNKETKLLSLEDAKKTVSKLKTSTSGYRASTKESFNDDLIYSLTNAMVKSFQDSNQHTTIVGGDTRLATKKYAPIVRDILLNKGINVLVPQLEGARAHEISPIPTPILALCAKKYGISLGVLLTASHNPWEDGGYNWITSQAAIADDKKIAPVLNNLIYIAQNGTPKNAKTKGKCIVFNPYLIYKKYLEDNCIIDFENIKKCDMDIFYEGFGGVGAHYLPRLFHENGINVKDVLNTKTEGPNPTAANLSKLANLVKKSNKPIRIGLATDGDGDRFGIIDEKGNFISTNDVLLLCAYHLIKNKGMKKGTIIKNHSTSDKIAALAKYFNQNGYDIDIEQTPVGFKYLGSKMLELENTNKEVILAGEDSGGLTVRGHIPEKDGFVAIGNILELVAVENKPIGIILKELNNKINCSYITNCINMRFKTDETKKLAIKNFEKYFDKDETAIAGIKIDYPKTLACDKKLKEYKPGGDGIKLYLVDGSSVLIRKSGTEPILRLSIDATSKESYDKLYEFLLSSAKKMGGIKK